MPSVKGWNVGQDQNSQEWMEGRIAALNGKEAWANPHTAKGASTAAFNSWLQGWTFQTRFMEERKEQT